MPFCNNGDAKAIELSLLSSELFVEDEEEEAKVPSTSLSGGGKKKDWHLNYDFEKLIKLHIYKSVKL